MNVVYATTSSWITAPWGVPVYVGGGTHWDADDPLVLAHPDAFSSDPSYGLQASSRPANAPVVFVGPPPAAEPDRAETATAEPGQRRNARRS